MPARRSAPSAPPPDVKAVDFYGPDGRVVGARVTGVRPGSRLAGAGLLRGDVVSRAEGTTVVSARDLRERLGSGEPIAALGGPVRRQRRPRRDRGRAVRMPAARGRSDRDGAAPLRQPRFHLCFALQRARHYTRGDRGIALASSVGRDPQSLRVGGPARALLGPGPGEGAAMRKFGVGIFSCAVLVAVLAAVLSASPPGGLNLQGLSHPDYHVRAAAVDRLVQDCGRASSNCSTRSLASHHLLEKAGLVEAIRRVGLRRGRPLVDQPPAGVAGSCGSPGGRSAPGGPAPWRPTGTSAGWPRISREVAAVRVGGRRGSARRGRRCGRRCSGYQARDRRTGDGASRGAPDAVGTPAIGNENVAQVAADATRPWADRRVAIRALGGSPVPGGAAAARSHTFKEARVRSRPRNPSRSAGTQRWGRRSPRFWWTAGPR